MARKPKKWARAALNEGSPRLWSTDRLTARWLVFTDRVGNLVIVDLNADRPFGIDEAMERPPMILIAATTDEYAGALEQLLDQFKRVARPDRRHVGLTERVEEELARYHGIRRGKPFRTES